MGRISSVMSGVSKVVKFDFIIFLEMSCVDFVKFPNYDKVLYNMW